MFIYLFRLVLRCLQIKLYKQTFGACESMLRDKWRKYKLIDFVCLRHHINNNNNNNDNKQQQQQQQQQWQMKTGQAKSWPNGLRSCMRPLWQQS